MAELKEVVSGLEELSTLITKLKNEKKLGEAEITEIRELLINFCGEKMASSSICGILDSIVTRANNGEFDLSLLTELHHKLTEYIEEKNKAKVIPFQRGSVMRIRAKSALSVKR